MATTSKAATSEKRTEWDGVDSAVCREVEAQAKANLDAYRVNPPLLREQVNIELAAAEGGYGRRQLYELIQNGADALLAGSGGRIHVVLTDNAFYCGNEGEPIDVEGVRAILLSNVSQKRGDEIGRFGLGFKSVLEVTSSPEFYSRSGSFAWNYARTVEAVAEAVGEFDPTEQPAPKLRLAWPIEPGAAFERDQVLAEMSEWATTIVKLPFAAGEPAWLGENIANFPKEFLLFCRHVHLLVLENRASSSYSDPAAARREIAIEKLVMPKGFYKLSEAGADSVWAVFSTVHEPSAAALEDAGTMSRRERVPIHWAMPVAGRVGPGVLWAFFPTEYETTLSGIVNAPWKTNPDRKNLLEGPFNREVLNVVSQLVIASLQKLHDRKDPGRLLDLIPGRGDEAKNWADRTLTTRYYELAAEARSIPDMTGELQLPADLVLHPRLKKSGEEGRAAIQHLLEIWADAAPESSWCHPSVERRERRPRVERLIKDGNGEIATWRSWLEALVADPTVEGSKAALRIAALAVSEGFTPGHAVEVATIVLTTDGRVVAPDPDKLFFQSDYAAADAVDFVHADLAADGESRRALEQLGITAVDASADLENLLRGSFASWAEGDWEAFWEVVRRVGPDRAAGIIKARRKRPFARVQSGRFRPIVNALMPGEIVPDDPSRDRDIVIDVAYHAPDLELLRELGVLSAPEARRGSKDEMWFDQYRAEAIVRYRHMLTGNRRPREALLGFATDGLFAGPLSALEWLSDEGRVLMTDAALRAETDLAPWIFGHTTQPDQYPKLEMPAPTTWRLQDEGRFRTSRGIRPASRCVAPNLSEWAEMLPVAECSPATADLLGLPTTVADLTENLWQEAIAATLESTNDELIGRIYAEASRYIGAPPLIRCRIGDAHAIQSPDTISVVASASELKALAPQGVPTILVPTVDDADRLRTSWRLSSEQKVETNVAYGVSGAEVPVVDRFPALQWHLEQAQRETVLVPCTELRLETITGAGRTAEDLELYREDGRIYFNEQLGDKQLLVLLAPALGLELDDTRVDQVIEKGFDAERRRRVADIRKEESVEGRLLAAIDENSLRSRLPRGLLAALEAGDRTLTGVEIAELALAVYGVDVLRVFRGELESAGLDPPHHWSGSPPALAYVRRLGFPREFAGFEHPRRSPLLEVEGPPNVPDLHPYQRLIVDEFRRLLRGELGGKRAMISLPTGAGKTRVAVQAVIEAIRHDGLVGPILWVAQNDELCEQAVQTWSFVWRGSGPAREQLSISRLWGSNETQPAGSAAHVVVAGIQKLQAGCIGDPEYAWLAEAGCVIVDEAHHSTAKSYGDLRAWLGLERRKEARPLIGLTATPYRGISKEETERLVGTYGSRRLDATAFGDQNPYPILQEAGILANVEHRLLKGADVRLDAKELAHLRKMRVLPSRAEGELGRSVERNQRILAEIMRLPDDWTILLFATSVDHAQTMAALLTLEGITAKPITGLTDDGPRRHYIEEFREGRIRVLTNYNVLTQGFDAPAVRAVIVGRPTFSPNLYQQMIGRGLRGPENGGKDTCLIVNVADNVVAYGEELAFRDFEYLWKSP